MQSANVLIVEDERLICWSIEQTLRAAGYDVAVASTAEEGMERFRQLLPKVVFLDVRLPDGSGLTLLERIKAESRAPTAVIVMTAYGETEAEAEARRMGASKYLSKPFAFEELEKIVASAITETSTNGSPIDA